MVAQSLLMEPVPRRLPIDISDIAIIVEPVCFLSFSFSGDLVMSTRVFKMERLEDRIAPGSCCGGCGSHKSHKSHKSSKSCKSHKSHKSCH